jgi:hypothetical protein
MEFIKLAIGNKMPDKVISLAEKPVLLCNPTIALLLEHQFYENSAPRLLLRKQFVQSDAIQPHTI